MSTSLDDIWNEPLLQSPAPNREVQEEGSPLHSYRPRKSTLFLSDDENGNESEQPSRNVGTSSGERDRPDIDALFEDLDEPDVAHGKTFDLDAYRKEAEQRALRDAPMPTNSFSNHAIGSSSPPRGFGSSNKRGNEEDDEDDETKRKSRPKLDAERLLGKDGFPALVKLCKDFKPKGKGHEVSLPFAWCSTIVFMTTDIRFEQALYCLSILVSQDVPQNSIQRYYQPGRKGLSSKANAGG